MIDIPRGFLTIPTNNNDGSYIPFFLKVREEDIIWQNSSIKPIIENLISDSPNIETLSPIIYKFDIENSNQIIIDTNDFIYIEKNNEYYKYSIINNVKEEDSDINDDGCVKTCLFHHKLNENLEIVSKPNSYIIKNKFYNITNTWHCRLNSDGFLSTYTYIPMTNFVNIIEDDKYFAYSLFNYNKTETFIDSWILENLKLPLPILYDTINIKIEKRSGSSNKNINEFINSFVATSFDSDTTNAIINEEPVILNLIKNINIRINTINKIDEISPILSTLQKCGLFINITGNIPII